LKSLLIIILWFFCGAAFAQVSTVPASYTSVFAGNPPGTYTGIDCCGEDTTGKAPCGFTRDADTFVLMLSGQSLYGNNVNGAITASSAVCNYNPYDGHLYADGLRLLGPLADGAGVCANPDGSQCRDNLGRFIAAQILSGTYPSHFNKVILISVPIGGSQANFWSTGAYAPHLTGIVASLVSHGMTPHAVAWGIGESDNQAGTTQAAFYSDMSTVISNARAAGLPSIVPWIIALETMISVGGVPTSSAPVRTAQLQLVDHANYIFNGPDFDTNIPYNSTCRLLPSPHLTGLGSCWPALPAITGGGAGWAAYLWTYKLHAAGAF
jgi:hypothetical protein